MTTFTEFDKLQAEVKKLLAEIGALNRPYLKQPGSWIAIGALGISGLYNYYQYRENVTVEIARRSEKQEAENLAKVNTIMLENESHDLETKKATLERNLKDLGQQNDDLIARIEADKMVLNNTSSAPVDKQTALNDVLQALGVAQNANNDAVKSVSAPIAPDYKMAHNLELQGFDLLTAGKLEQARQAFDSSDAAANGYHSSYEIAKLLRQAPSAMHDDDSRKALLDLIANKFAAYATPAQRERLKALSK